MISLNKVTFSYPGSVRPVLQEFDLRVERLAWVAITGPVGAGKTTLAKLMAGLLEPDSGDVLSGAPADTDGIPVAMLGGDPADSLVGASVEEDVVFGLENLGLERSEIKRRLELALGWTGLSGMEARLTDTLSGGEQQKLALASALAMGAAVLILDEALCMLDRAARKAARELIDSLRMKLSMTVIEITHELEDALASSRLLFLSGGRVEFDGPPVEFLATPQGERWARMGRGIPGLLAVLRKRGFPLPDSVDLRDPSAALTSWILSNTAR